MKNLKKYQTEIKIIRRIFRKIKKKINKILNFLPNIALEDVPIGKDEKSNKELTK